MRILFLLPGMHRVERGAEVAFGAIAGELARLGADVTVVGSGVERPGTPYRFEHSPVISRRHFQRFPKIPPLRSEYAYEDATFLAAFAPRYRPSQYDVTVSCSYPFINWLLSRWPRAAQRPSHIYITQNGDWPAYNNHREFRAFRCDGLVCTNPMYFERNAQRWRSALIPNGIDPDRFCPGPPTKERFGVPADAPLVVMASALVVSKRVLEAVRAVAQIPDAHLIVAGDGPQRGEVDVLTEELMPGRFQRMTLDGADMPDLYRSADAFLHTSLFESFGNVYVEAMACGTPVVAHRYGVTEWIFGDYDELVDTEDEATMVDALNRAIAVEKGTLTERSAEIRRRFAWSTIGEQYFSFITDVVASPDRR